MSTYIVGYRGLTGDDDLSNLLSGLTPSSTLAIDSGSNMTSIPLTDGQLLIGSTGVLPIATSLLGGSNINITNGAGSIAINTKDDPVFDDITLNSLTASALVATDSKKALQSCTINNANGCNTSFTGAILTSTMTQDLSTIGTPSWAGLTLSNLTASMPIKTNVGKQLVSSLISLTSDIVGVLPLANGGTGVSVTLTDGQLLIGNTGNLPSTSTITGTGDQVNVANGPGSITLSLPQSIGTTSSPTFAAETLSGSFPLLSIVNVDSNVNRASLQLSGMNGTNPFQMQQGSSGTAFIENFSDQPINMITAGGVSMSSLTASMPIKTNGSKILVSSLISLTSDVTGVLPSANGGVPQALSSTSSPTFAAETLSGTHPLITIINTASNANRASLQLSGMNGTNPFQMQQSETGIGSLENWGGHIVLLPTGTVRIGNLTASMPVKSDTDKGLVSSLISLTSDVTGVLPTANGGVGSMSDGQLIIGRTGLAPLAASITGTADRVTVTNSAGAINVNLPDNITLSGRIYARPLVCLDSCYVYSTATMPSVVSGTWTQVAFSGTSFSRTDPLGIFDHTSNRYKVNVNGAGHYKILINMRIEDVGPPSATDTTGVAIRLNGSGTNIRESFAAVDPSGRRCINYQCQINLNGNDELRIFAYHVAGPNLFISNFNIEILRIF